MKRESRHYPIRLLCKCMQVSPSGYYHWLNKPVSPRSKQNDYILLQIIRAFKQSRQLYGSPRIHRELLAQGFRCGVNRIAKLMQQHGIVAITKGKHRKTHAARNTKGFTDNVLSRNFSAVQPNQKWVSDTTFINTAQGWLYLATVIDLYSRKVVGWSMSKRNDTVLVSQALSMAIRKKKGAQPVLLHSDQGSQYRAAAYLHMLKQHNIQQSMSMKGKCLDNAVAESFFGTLKNEFVYQTHYK
ncbi:MAG: IS3 family transposase, partial [Ghiorsea sp.]|nr:IS3 family transposase [Ghiorsea sp.]